MDDKYMRRAELRWANHDAERLEHIRKKREKRRIARAEENAAFFKGLELIANTKEATSSPAPTLKLYNEGDLYAENGQIIGHFACEVTYTKKEAVSS